MILTSIVLGVAVSVLAVELLGVSRWLAYKLILRAVEFLPDSEKERWKEEWLTELEKIHKFGLFLPQLWFAINTYFGAPKLGMVLRNSMQFDDNFGLFKYMQVLLIFNLLRLLSPITAFIFKRTKDKDKKRKALELCMTVDVAKVLLGCFFAPRWFKKYSERLLKNRTSKEVI